MAHHSVPRTTEVVPGALVNIVLKADQRTGRQVRGTVRDVLTRGDHYRGIKVRLADGRIGRVQSLASGTVEPSPPLNEHNTSPENGPTQLLLDMQAPTAGGMPSSRDRGQQPRYRDVRLDEPLDTAPEQIDLAAYIVPSKRKGKGKGKKGPRVEPTDTSTSSDAPAQDTDPDAAATDVTTATAKCPVCGAFEGDEAAVAHHVAEHFE
ncbi:Uu.00g020960.m01.CDS01 [Anthostomella pinea]|uniref:Uu.00g020960.m01.CDS01 n=1 Tax=Anthostomella pinea TaxID=933095 RepID=A0AAI8VZK4_9PEZI|nr:Uu.00g020960.m01.CDS01 [Anthostomella pinea]